MERIVATARSIARSNYARTEISGLSAPHSWCFWFPGRAQEAGGKGARHRVGALHSTTHAGTAQTTKEGATIVGSNLHNIIGRKPVPPPRTTLFQRHEGADFVWTRRRLIASSRNPMRRAGNNMKPYGGSHRPWTVPKVIVFWSRPLSIERYATVPDPERVAAPITVRVPHR